MEMLAMNFKTLCCWILATIPLVSHADTLTNNDILMFTTAAGSQVSGLAGGGIVFDSASLDALNGLKIGSVQSSVPDIDQQWLSTRFGVAGNHSTSSSVEVLGSNELDFSGWTMTVAGETYHFGATQSVASYVLNGDQFVLEYSWDAAADNGGIALGSLNVSSYNLTLAGTVSTVPLPAGAWLMASALVGLVGLKRKNCLASGST
jgi:hypothetical protein